MDDELDRINSITEKVIGCAFRVSNTLGIGFLEKVYENSMAHDLKKIGLLVRQQVEIAVYYDNVVVGFYRADLFVEELVAVEIKHVKGLDDAHVAQTLNYLRAARHRVGLLLNFGTSRVEVKRVIHGRHAKTT
jgi:GxxExxY protein